MGWTEEEVVHRVNDNLFNQIEVRKARELGVAGCVFLDKVFASSRCAEPTIVIAKSTMLLTGPAVERYNRQTSQTI
jgi:hypothetical protein